MTADDVTRHYPGLHNQAHHGRRYKTPGDRKSGLRELKNALQDKGEKADKVAAVKDAALAKAAAPAKRKTRAKAKADDGNFGAVRLSAELPGQGTALYAVDDQKRRQRPGEARATAAKLRADGHDGAADAREETATVYDLAIKAAAEPDGLLVVKDHVPSKAGRWAVIDGHAATALFDTQDQAESYRKAHGRRPTADPAPRTADADRRPGSPAPAEKPAAAAAPAKFTPGDGPTAALSAAADHPTWGHSEEIRATLRQLAADVKAGRMHGGQAADRLEAMADDRTRLAKNRLHLRALSRTLHKERELQKSRDSREEAPDLEDELSPAVMHQGIERPAGWLDAAELSVKKWRGKWDVVGAPGQSFGTKREAEAFILQSAKTRRDWVDAERRTENARLKNGRELVGPADLRPGDVYIDHPINGKRRTVTKVDALESGATMVYHEKADADDMGFLLLPAQDRWTKDPFKVERDRRPDAPADQVAAVKAAALEKAAAPAAAAPVDVPAPERGARGEHREGNGAAFSVMNELYEEMTAQPTAQSRLGNAQSTADTVYNLFDHVRKGTMSNDQVADLVGRLSIRHSIGDDPTGPLLSAAAKELRGLPKPKPRRVTKPTPAKPAAADPVAAVKAAAIEKATAPAPARVAQLADGGTVDVPPPGVLRKIATTQEQRADYPHVESINDLAPGDVVFMAAHGDYRRGVVTGKKRSNVTVAYTTETSPDHVKTANTSATNVLKHNPGLGARQAEEARQAGERAKEDARRRRDAEDARRRQDAEESAQRRAAVEASMNQQAAAWADKEANRRGGKPVTPQERADLAKVGITLPDAPAPSALAGMSAEDEKRIRNAVADRGPGIFTSPAVGGSKSDVGRYLAEGELGKQLAERHDWRTVWKAVREVVDENPAVLDRTPAQAKADAEARAASVKELVDQAQQSVKTDKAQTVKLLDQALALDPDAKLTEGGRAGYRLSEVRASVAKSLHKERQAAQEDDQAAELTARRLRNARQVGADPVAAVKAAAIEDAKDKAAASPAKPATTANTPDAVMADLVAALQELPGGKRKLGDTTPAASAAEIAKSLGEGRSTAHGVADLLDVMAGLSDRGNANDVGPIITAAAARLRTMPDTPRRAPTRSAPAAAATREAVGRPAAPAFDVPPPGEFYGDAVAGADRAKWPKVGSADDVAPGDVVFVTAGGAMRRGVVTDKEGSAVTVAYVTERSADDVKTATRPATSLRKYNPAPAADPVAAVKEAALAKATAAVELTTDGAETAYVPGARSTIGLAERPQVGRKSAPEVQLGLFADLAAEKKREIAGQGALLDAMFNPADLAAGFLDAGKGGTRR